MSSLDNSFKHLIIVIGKETFSYLTPITHYDMTETPSMMLTTHRVLHKPSLMVWWFQSISLFSAPSGDRRNLRNTGKWLDMRGSWRGTNAEKWGKQYGMTHCALVQYDLFWETQPATNKICAAKQNLLTHALRKSTASLLSHLIPWTSLSNPDLSQNSCSTGVVRWDTLSPWCTLSFLRGFAAKMKGIFSET